MVEITTGNITTGYASLAKAVEAANDGDKLNIMDNIDLGSDSITIKDKSITIDLNGKTITYTGSTIPSAINLTGSSYLIVTDTSENGNGTIEATKSVINNRGSGVKILGGTLKATDSTYIGVIANNSQNTIEITGGSVYATSGTAIYNFMEGEIKISGGIVSALTGNGIYNVSTGKITISGTAKVTSANTETGTIYFSAVPTSENKTILTVEGNAVISNTANGYSIYFDVISGVISENVNDYYTNNGGALGKIFPTPPSTSGSTGSGSGGSRPSSKPSTDETPSTITEGEIKVEGNVDESGNTIVTLPEQIIKDAVKQAEAEAKENGDPKSGISLVIHVDTNNLASGNKRNLSSGKGRCEYYCCQTR